jgi:hypothetical protein
VADSAAGRLANAGFCFVAPACKGSTREVKECAS